MVGGLCCPLYPLRRLTPMLFSPMTKRRAPIPSDCRERTSTGERLLDQLEADHRRRFRTSEQREAEAKRVSELFRDAEEHFQVWAAQLKQPDEVARSWRTIASHSREFSDLEAKLAALRGMDEQFELLATQLKIPDEALAKSREAVERKIGWLRRKHGLPERSYARLAEILAQQYTYVRAKGESARDFCHRVIIMRLPAVRNAVIGARATRNPGNPVRKVMPAHIAEIERLRLSGMAIAVACYLVAGENDTKAARIRASYYRWRKRKRQSPP